MDPGDVAAERFEVELHAGSGGMGAVYRARDRVGGGKVALKVLHAQGALESARFAREASVLAALAHPAIVRFVAHGVARTGERYLATAWLEGESLAERLAQRGLTVAETLLLGTRIAEGLAAAHALGIVHRDIKPSNLLLVGGDPAAVQILDFGIAHRGDDEQSLTQVGARIGTPGYMAPEQARGDGPVDASADVFSLGCVLFRCLTGRRPFEADDAMALLLKLIQEEAPRLASLRDDASPALDDLLARMLSKLPAERPSDGAALALELAAISAIAQQERGPGETSASLPAAISTAERRVMCVVLARIPAIVDASPAHRWATPDARRPRLGEALEAYGGQAALLADRSLLVTVPTAGAFTDQAARAACSALVVRHLHAGAAIAVVVGRGQIAARLPMGEVIDRGVALLHRARPGEIRLDEAMAGLLAASFDVGVTSGEGAAEGPCLVGEREREGTRTLLGRVAPFVGRERELRTLQAIFDACVEERAARAVLIHAPAGAGKSRLRVELIHRLRERAASGSSGVGVWLARVDPLRGPSRFGLLASMIRGLAEIRDGESIEARRGKLRARVARHVARSEQARVTVFLGELAGVPFLGEESVALVTARGDATSMDDHMRRAFEDLVAAECAEEPQILVIEDLHGGDHASLQVIDGALRTLEGSPWMVLALARPEASTRFPGLWAGRGVTEIALGNLGKKASEQLVRAMLGEGVDGATVERVIALAGGDPLSLEELIRAVAAGDGSALPETILGRAQEQLDGLDGETRRILRAASVFGRVFWRGGVSALLGDAIPAPALADVLADLERRDVIQRQPLARFPGEDEHAFRQSVVREAVYAMLTEQDRALGHRLAGAWLARAGERDAEVLAEHVQTIDPLPR